MGGYVHVCSMRCVLMRIEGLRCMYLLRIKRNNRPRGMVENFARVCRHVADLRKHLLTIKKES